MTLWEEGYNMGNVYAAIKSLGSVCMYLEIAVMLAWLGIAAWDVTKMATEWNDLPCRDFAYKKWHGNSLSSIYFISSTTFTQQVWLIYFLFSTTHQHSHPFLPSPLYTSSPPLLFTWLSSFFLRSIHLIPWLFLSISFLFSKTLILSSRAPCVRSRARGGRKGL